MSTDSNVSINLISIDSCKLQRITRPGLDIRKKLLFGHYSGSNSRLNSGPIFDSISCWIPIVWTIKSYKYKLLLPDSCKNLTFILKNLANNSIFDSVFDLDPSILRFGFDSTKVTKLKHSPRQRISSQDPTSLKFGQLLDWRKVVFLQYFFCHVFQVFGCLWVGLSNGLDFECDLNSVQFCSVFR